MSNSEITTKEKEAEADTLMPSEAKNKILEEEPGEKTRRIGQSILIITSFVVLVR